MTEAIKSMKLYSAVERIHHDLEEAGFSRTDPLTVAALTPYDQLHYHGTDAVDLAIVSAGLGPGAEVLDIGSGFGGPARYLAEASGAHVTAVELQADMNATAADLTERCGLSDRVDHVEGDILAVELPLGRFDAMISYLALYHIPDRAPLFPKVAAALKHGGRIHVEDLYARASFTAAEQLDLDGMLFANTMPTRETYIAELAEAGFTDIDFQDMTADWTAFTQARLRGFRENRDRHFRVHGADTVAALDEFYATMVRLFEGGHLGGVRYTATRG